MLSLIQLASEGKTKIFSDPSEADLMAKGHAVN
jgi:hypothetical protein